jgi:hypothetical protein
MAINVRYYQRGGGKRMMNKKMIVLIGVAALMASTVTMNTQSGIVQHAEASSAFNNGYDEGREDALDDNEKNASCDPYNSDSNPDAYCALYKIGYEAGWAAARALYRDQ